MAGHIMRMYVRTYLRQYMFVCLCLSVRPSERTFLLARCGGGQTELVARGMDKLDEIVNNGNLSRS